MEYSMDNIYLIGADHKVCEDYAWSGLIHGKYPCIIISDGCSSSPHTDIGARIMVRGMIATLNEIGMAINNRDDQLFYRINMTLMVNVVSMCKAMNLPMDSLDATIRVVIMNEYGLFMYQFGDGLTVLKNHTTDETVLDIHSDFNSNAPYYFSYECDKPKQSAYLEKYGDDYVHFSDEEFGFTDAKTFIEKNHFFWNSVDFGNLNAGVYTISVMSDGVASFYDGEGVIDSKCVVNDILSFKNFNGEFVQRKVKMYISRGAKKNIKHGDDISIASIKFEVKNHVEEETA